jgi:hypothetical protein
MSTARIAKTESDATAATIAATTAGSKINL